MKQRRTQIIILVLVIAFVITYTIFDPSDSAFFPKCMFHSLTGLQCPGCGLQRMVHALFHGDIISAWRSNAFMLIASPFIIAIFLLEFRREQYPKLYQAVYSMKSITLLITLFMIWFVVRNILGI